MDCELLILLKQVSQPLEIEFSLDRARIEVPESHRLESPYPWFVNWHIEDIGSILDNPLIDSQPSDVRRDQPPLRTTKSGRNAPAYCYQDLAMRYSSRYVFVISMER